VKIRYSLLGFAITLVLFARVMTHPTVPWGVAAEICLVISAAIFFSWLYRVDPPDDDWPPRGQNGNDPHNFPLSR
jgi:hypothetical protein